MMKLTGLGNALVDILIEMKNEVLLEELGLKPGTMTLVTPEVSELILQRAKGLPMQLVAGGSVANTLHGFASLGGDCLYVGKVGPDPLGEVFAESLRSAGVRLALAKSNRSTGVAATFISPDSERTFATSLSASLDMSAADLKEEMFLGSDWLYGDGYTSFDPVLLRTALKMAKSAGLKIAFDLASPNVVSENKELFWEVVREYADLIFANEEESYALTGEEPEQALRILLRYCEMAVVKLGEDGSLAGCGDSVCKIMPVAAHAKDTTGAGDLYAAGFLFGIGQNLPVSVCGEIGSLLSAKVVEKIGSKIHSALWPSVRHEVQQIISKASGLE